MLYSRALRHAVRFRVQVPIPHVAAADRLLLAPLEFKGFYRCVARYGYMDKVDQVSAHQNWKHCLAVPSHRCTTIELGHALCSRLALASAFPTRVLLALVITNSRSNAAA